MKQLVLSIEQMNHLAELGLNISDSSFGYIKDSDGFYYLEFYDACDFEKGAIPAYTLQDILEKLTSTDRQSVVLHDSIEWLDVAYDKLCFELTHKE